MLLKPIKSGFNNFILTNSFSRYASTLILYYEKCNTCSIQDFVLNFLYDINFNLSSMLFKFFSTIWFATGIKIQNLLIVENWTNFNQRINLCIINKSIFFYFLLEKIYPLNFINRVGEKNKYNKCLNSKSAQFAPIILSTSANAPLTFYYVLLTYKHT